MGALINGEKLRAGRQHFDSRHGQEALVFVRASKTASGTHLALRVMGYRGAVSLLEIFGSAELPFLWGPPILVSSKYWGRFFLG